MINEALNTFAPCMTVEMVKLSTVVQRLGDGRVSECHWTAKWLTGGTEGGAVRLTHCTRRPSTEGKELETHKFLTEGRAAENNWIVSSWKEQNLHLDYHNLHDRTHINTMSLAANFQISSYEDAYKHINTPHSSVFPSMHHLNLLIILQSHRDGDLSQLTVSRKLGSWGQLDKSYETSIVIIQLLRFCFSKSTP